MKADVFKMPVHPAAAIFPMLDEGDLDQLAEDIRENGLRFPLIVQDGHLVDGRNRREACKRAGVTPAVEELPAETDATGYVLSANISRRHMTKAQRVMAVAMVYPDPEKTAPGRKAKATTAFDTKGVSLTGISKARTVLRWLPEIAAKVLAGTKPLDEAYQEAQWVKDSADGEGERLVRLRERAPDLADLVDEGRMKLAEAEAAYEKRVADEERHRLAVIGLLAGMERLLQPIHDANHCAHFAAMLKKNPADRSRAMTLAKHWIESLTRLQEAL